MLPRTAVVVPLLLLALLASGSGAVSPNSEGMAQCFGQVLAASLARLHLNNAYICALNALIGPLSGFDFEPFGPNHGFPILQSEEESFFDTSYGTPDGGFVAVDRVNVTSYSAVGYYMHNSTTRMSYYLDSKGQLTSEVFTIQEYEVTSRPWYQGALNSASGSYVTTTPYRFSQKSLRVTSSRQCKDANDTLQIIPSADLTLDTLTTKALTSTSCPLFDKNEGTVFVVNADGILIMQNDVVVDDIYLATNATGLVKAAAKYVASLNGDEWDKKVSGEIQYDGETYEVLAYPMRGTAHSVDISEWGWTIITAQRTASLCNTGAASSLRPFGWLLW